MCKLEVEKLMPEIESSIKDMTALESVIVSQQHQRQKDIWTLLKYAVSKPVHVAEGLDHL